MFHILLFAILLTDASGAVEESDLCLTGGDLDVENPDELSRSYSSVWGGDYTNNVWRKSMIDSSHAWVAQVNTAGQWMIIDLGSVMTVLGVITQGRYYYGQWVTEYTVSHSSTDTEDSSFTAVGETFTGNSDSSTKVENRFANGMQLSARYLKIYPTHWYRHISMRAGALVPSHLCESSNLGNWYLAGNVNPCDGNNFGYGGPWSQNVSIGSPGASLTNDFIDNAIWNMPLKYITIARHEDGVCAMSKTWQLLDSTQSLQDYFSTYPGQIFATGDGSSNDIHISADMPATGFEADPIFGADGGLVFNWYYSNNGARIANPGTYKDPYVLPTSQNNDDVHGLGNEFGGNTEIGRGGNGMWHDVGKMQGDCAGSNCMVVGTDHGHDMNSGECWGSYAIYVTADPITTFDCLFYTLRNTIPHSDSGRSDIDQSRTYQRCGDEEIAADVGITAIESILENGMATFSISFPGYMDLVNISLQESTMELPYENWEIVTADECFNDTTATTIVSFTELIDATNMTMDGSSLIFSINVELNYASYIRSTDTFALLPVMKTVYFSVDTPSSYVVRVRFLLEEGSDIVFDIMSYSVIEDDVQSVVLLDFQTYVISSYEFIGNGSITTDYFNAGSTLELTSTSDFEHPEFGAGKVQMWKLTLVEPSKECTTGVHTVPVILDLASAESSERIELNIALADDYRMECSNNIGELEISSVVSIDAGEGFVLLNGTEVGQSTVLMDSVVYFNIDFSSEIPPSTVSIVRADGFQDGVQVCDDCLASLNLTCSTCDESGVSSGATYDFGISMNSSVFQVPNAGSIFSTVEMDFEFAFTYDGRRALLKVASSKSGARFLLRDYDCHYPTGFFGEVKQIACLTPGHVKKAFCHSSGAWEDNSSCAPEVAWPLTNIIAFAGGVVSLAFVYLAVKIYALKPTYNYSPVQV